MQKANDNVDRLSETYVPQSFEEFAELWQGRIRAAAYRRRLRNDDLDECTQDVLIYLWKGDYLGRFDPNRTTFRKYIYSMIRFRVADYWTKHYKTMVAEKTLGDLTPEECQRSTIQDDPSLAAVELRLDDRRAILALKNAIDQLSERYPGGPNRKLTYARILRVVARQIFEMGDKSFKDMGEEFQVTRQAVSWQFGNMLDTDVMKAFREELLRILEDSQEPEDSQ